MPDLAATPAVPSEFVRDGSPLIETLSVPSCPMCGHGSASTYAVGYDYELRTCRNPWRFVSCDRCTHVWLNPRPATATLPVIYPPHYYAYNYAQQTSKLALGAKNWLDRRKFRSITRLLGQPARSFVDIGCGDGRYLRLMDRMGVPKGANFGLELDAGVVAGLCAEGFRGITARVEDCDDIAPGSIDLATMFNVIEHVDDPGAVTARVARWLAPGGLFAIETPNIDCWERQLFGRGFWGGYHIPRHWNLFTPTTLGGMMHRAGLEVISLRYQTGHSFWMYSLHHSVRYRGNGHPKLGKLFDPFGGLLPALAGFTAFDKARIALGCRTGEMTLIARKPAAT